MYEAVYIAATGLTNQQRRIDTIADNVANVNTVGFKAARTDFKDALYTAWMGPVATPDGNIQKGHGVMTAVVTRNFANGNVMVTENQLDFAIAGDGYFEVMNANGEMTYTKSGNFYIGTSGGAGNLFIVDSKGQFVMSEGGGRIQVPDGTTKLEVSTLGEITFMRGDEDLGSERFGLYTFPNDKGLLGVGSSAFQTTVASGDKVQANDIVIRQGALESSNVNMSQEMTRLIRAQRAFSLAGKALTTADDMEGLANSLRR